MEASASSRSSAGAPRYPLSSVDHALRIVELLRVEPAMRLSDVALEIGVANSTAHRLLAALAHRGFVEQQPDTRLYTIGAALVDIGRSALLVSELPSRVRPLLETLNAKFGETIHLGVREGTSVRYLDAVESSRAVRVAARTGRRLHAHWSSIGKVLLATLTEDAVRRLYAPERFEPGTVHSIDSLDRLLDELAITRSRGYAVNTGESEEDVASVAVPLHDRGGVVIAAVGCSAPRHRLHPEDAASIASSMLAIVDSSDFASRP
jgi:IclR family transcriptional regulator, acetate operon repressor